MFKSLSVAAMMFLVACAPMESSLSCKCCEMKQCSKSEATCCQKSSEHQTMKKADGECEICKKSEMKK